MAYLDLLIKYNGYLPSATEEELKECVLSNPDGHWRDLARAVTDYMDIVEAQNQAICFNKHGTCEPDYCRCYQTY